MVEEVRALQLSFVLLVVLGACRSDGPPGEQLASAQSGEQPPKQPDEPSGEQPATELASRDRVRAERKRACVRDHLGSARPRDQALLRSLCAEWVEREVPGLALAIVEPDAEPVHVELGVRCFGEPGPVEQATPFRLGSITKTLTAALVFGAVADGRLRLDEGVGGRVAGFRAPSGLVRAPGGLARASGGLARASGGLADPTLEALLGHRSGLGEIEPEDLVELEGAWLPALARSAPGTVGEFRYSNAGYSLVGAMLGAAAGRSYVELVADELAAPLGLDSLGADPARARAPACGHLAHDPDLHPISVREDLDFMPGDPSWMAPAGGALASATDLARLALALGTERLPGTARMLDEPGTPLPPTRATPRRPDERYGYGLRSWALADGTRAYGHSGDNVAFRAELLFVPGRRAIVLLANRGTELTATVAAAEALLEAP